MTLNLILSHTISQWCSFYKRSLSASLCWRQPWRTTTPRLTTTKAMQWFDGSPPHPRRTTWSIIWSCMSIRIVCPWECVDLNIPTHQEAKGKWHALQIKSLPDISVWPKAPLSRKKKRRKVFWMGGIALAPGFGVALAIRQYMIVHKDLKDANKGSRKL
jgi:hypothetical protein